jgi:HEAT repeat protein
MKSLKLLGLMAALTLLVSLAHAEDEVIDKPKPTTEAGWIEQLKTGEDFAAKSEACRALHRLGTAEAVPVLAGLLTDPELSSWARFALEPIPSDTADHALLAALPDASTDLKAGIATSLGVRKVKAAVPPLTELLSHKDAAVAEAAAGALGRIGTSEAISALQAVESAPDTNLGVAVSEALLAAAEMHRKNGDAVTAVNIYHTALSAPGQTQPVGLGALRGLVNAQPEKAPQLISAALESDQDTVRDFAAQLVAETSGNEGTSAYADILTDLSASGQVALIRGLATRGDALAHPAISAQVKSPNEEVQIAAIKALGKLGRAADVVTLADFLVVENDEVSRAAAQSLRELEGDEIDTALASALQSSEAPARHAALQGILADRLADEAIPLAVEALESDDPTVRTAGLNTIVRMGTEEQFAPTAAALRRTEDKETRNLAGRALAVLCKRGGNTLLEPLEEALANADAEAQAVMTRCLDDIGTSEALATLVGLQDNDAEVVRDAAVDVLSNWPAQEAAPYLIALASSDNEDYQDAGFEGYVRLAREQGDPNVRADMLEAAMPLATRTQQQWRVLAVWGTTHTPRALEAVRPYLAEEGISNEAGAAIVSIAEELAKNADHRDIVIVALQDVVASGRAMVRDRAQALLDRVKQEQEQA